MIVHILNCCWTIVYASSSGPSNPNSFSRSVKKIRNAFCSLHVINFRSRVQQRAQLFRVLWRSRMAASGVTGPGIPLGSRFVKKIALFSHGKELGELIPAFRGGKYRNWDDASMANAVEAVRRWKTVRRVAELYNVPRSMLSNSTGPLFISHQPSPQHLSTCTHETEN